MFHFSLSHIQIVVFLVRQAMHEQALAEAKAMILLDRNRRPVITLPTSSNPLFSPSAKEPRPDTISKPAPSEESLGRGGAGAHQGVDRGLGNVKALTGLLPFCASCKKIRDDQGYWTQIESYIHKPSEAKFSHGIKPASCGF